VIDDPAKPARTSCRICDARGREVELLDPMKLHLLRRPGAIESDVLDRIVNEVEPGMARMRPFALYAAVACFVLGVAVFLVSVAMGGGSAWSDLGSELTNPAVYVSSLAMVVWLPWMVVHQKRKRCGRVSAAMIKFRRCPHCGYSLQGLPVDPSDGATVCPECACAWRLDDPTLAARAAVSDGTAAGDPGRIQWILTALLAGLVVMAALGAIMMWRSMT
jgi:hypothetical protein